MILFGKLAKQVTIQGDVKLTMWKDGEVLYDETINGTEDISSEAVHLWDWQEAKYIFASPDGYLHIDFEREEE